MFKLLLLLVMAVLVWQCWLDSPFGLGVAVAVAVGVSLIGINRSRQKPLLYMYCERRLAHPDSSRVVT